MIFSLTGDRPAEETAREFLFHLLQEAVEVLGLVEEQPDHVVHELRRSNKRIRGLLRLFRHAMNRDSIRLVDRKVRDAAKCFAEVRDAFVLTEVAIAVRDRAGIEGEEAESVIGELSEVHQSHVQHLSLPALAAEVGCHFGEVIGLVESWKWPTLDPEVFFEGMIQLYRRGRKEFRHVEKTRSEEDFHVLRKRAKYLSFHADWLREGNPIVLADVAEKSAELATLLGDHHDLAVFADRMVELGERHPASRTFSEVAREWQSEIEEDCLTKGADFYRGKPRSRAVEWFG